MNSRILLREILRADLVAFIEKVFHTVSPGDIYDPNWHIEAVAHVLRRTQEGESRRLIINQPPRSLKSICTSVAFVAWALGHDPSRRFACVSYSNELAVALARQFRAVVTSPWYQELFPAMRLAKETETECLTTKSGGRLAVSIGGTLTGRGADVIIIDDPLKADEAHSAKARNFVNDWFGTTLISRLNDKGKGVIILVMQRLHEDDLAGKLLAEGGWEHLNLQAIATADERIPIGAGVFYRRKEGEVLHPAREPLPVLDKTKREMGSLFFSAQYQQRPVPLEGNLLKRDWFKWFEVSPQRQAGQIVQSWDVATTTGPTNDFSVCTTWLIVDKTYYYLLDVWRGRLEFPQLRRKVCALALAHSTDALIIEEAGPGLHLIQDLRGEPGIPAPIGIVPDKDKVVRMEAQSVRFEAGQVVLPKSAPWLDDFLHELLAFPNARHDDQVDSVSQFLSWAEKRRRYTPPYAQFGRYM